MTYVKRSARGAITRFANKWLGSWSTAPAACRRRCAGVFPPSHPSPCYFRWQVRAVKQMLQYNGSKAILRLEPEIWVTEKFFVSYATSDCSLFVRIPLWSEKWRLSCQNGYWWASSKFTFTDAVLTSDFSLLREICAAKLGMLGIKWFVWGVWGGERLSERKYFDIKVSRLKARTQVHTFFISFARDYTYTGVTKYVG